MKKCVKIIIVGVLLLTLLGCSRKSTELPEVKPADPVVHDKIDETDNSVVIDESEPLNEEVEAESETTETDERLIKYSDFLQDVISGKITPGNDEGMFFTFKDAVNPGFALFGLGGSDEYFLCLTDNINDKDHKYSIYYLDQDNNIQWGLSPTEYIPPNRWIVREGNIKKDYSYESWEKSFKLILMREYPEGDSDEVIYTDYYESRSDEYSNREIYEETESISKEQDEENLVSYEIHEPDDMKWVELTKETAEAVKSDPEKVFDMAEKYMKNRRQENKMLYYEKCQGLLDRIIENNEPINGEGEVYDFEIAPNPGYALYDINDDGIEELFITADKDNQWHTYSVYNFNNFDRRAGEELNGIFKAEVLNGFIPSSGLWTYGFEFSTDFYSYDFKNGFTHVYKIEYPVNDENKPVMIKYDGKAEEEITDNELNELIAGEVTEPEDLVWNKLTEETNLLE